DISTGTTRELMELPVVINGVTTTMLRDVDWTSNGHRFTAMAVNESADLFQHQLIIADVDDEIVVFDNGRINREPLWSPSEKWVAFYSKDEELGILYLTVIDASGVEVVDVEVENGYLLPSGYDWLTPELLSFYP